MKLLLSGGHLTPALALLDYCLQKKDDVVFVGRLYSQEGTKQLSLEKQRVEEHGVKFIAFSSGKSSQFTPWQIFSETAKLLWAIGKATHILLQEKPTVFVSFGGYLAVPLAIAAWFLHIPIVTHEQTRGSGLANKFIARLATAVAVTYEESVTLFPANKTFIVGNPVRHQIANAKSVPPLWYANKSSKPLLYITGGSQGSQVINAAVEQILPKLVQDWVVIHQCGNPSTKTNYRLELEHCRKLLPVAHQSEYFVREWLTDDEQAWIYAKAKAIISRSGANTVQELLILGKPAIFVPLLFAHGDEQTKNAQAVVETGAALLIPQKSLSSEKLLSTLSQFKRQYSSLLANAKLNQKKFDLHADQRLYDVIKKVVEK